MRPSLQRAFDVQHTFFIPLYRRVIVVALCAGWMVFEFANGHLFFALIFGAAGAWCVHQFFVAFNPKDPENKKDGGTS